MSEITQCPALSSGKSPETGPMQFGDDWPGVFIRGDNALLYAMSLAMIERRLDDNDRVIRAQLVGIINTLRSCRVGDTGWPPEPPSLRSRI